MLYILWLYPKHYWERKMSSVRRHSLLAIGRHSKIELHVSGVGWDDYDASCSVQENLERLMPNCDLLGWYKPLGEEQPLLNPSEAKVPRCLRFNEAWWPDQLALKEALDTGTELIICHHAEDLPQFDDPRVTPIHIPHCAERTVFDLSVPQESRNIPVLLTGSLDARLDLELYPLRKRVHEMITSGVLPGEVRPKPPSVTASIEETESQLRDYAAHLARAKIVITDGTKHLYPLAKYTEAAMAGALVIGTLPHCPPEKFEELVVPIDLDASPEEIRQTVDYWLEHDEERMSRAELGREVARKHFSQENYADHFFKAVDRFLKSCRHDYLS